MASRDVTGITADGLLLAHEKFRADVAKLAASVRPASPATLEEVRAELGAARTHAAEHFRLEEQSEWWDKVKRRGPKHEGLVRRLCHEHRELLEAITTLLDVVQVARNLNDSLREKIYQWVNRVRRHEDREDGLILRAYTLDIGAVD